MHAKSRIPSSGHNSPSPPQSPLSRSPRLRRKQGRFTPTGQPGPSALPGFFSLVFFVDKAFFCLPHCLLYICGMLFYMGTVSFDVVPVIHHRAAPGSVYRSPQLYAKLRPEIESDNSSADAAYLSQMDTLLLRRMICNTVAVAGYLNATLVIPHFHFHSIWRDPSKFGDIYDEEYFVKTLETDVRVVDKIPGYTMERFDYNMSNVFNFRVKAWSSIQYYRDTVLPKLLEEKLIRILLWQIDCHLMLLLQFKRLVVWQIIKL